MVIFEIMEKYCHLLGKCLPNQTGDLSQNVEIRAQNLNIGICDDLGFVFYLLKLLRIDFESDPTK